MDGKNGRRNKRFFFYNVEIKSELMENWFLEWHFEMAIPNWNVIEKNLPFVCDDVVTVIFIDSK